MGGGRGYRSGTQATAQAPDRRAQNPGALAMGASASGADLMKVNQSIDVINTHLAGVDNAVRTIAGDERINKAISEKLLKEADQIGRFRQGLSRVSNYTTAATGLITAADALMRGDGDAAQAALGDTAVHLALGSNPITGTIDFALTLAFGSDWPSKTVGAIARVPDNIAAALNQGVEAVETLGCLAQAGGAIAGGVMEGIIGSMLAFTDPSTYRVGSAYVAFHKANPDSGPPPAQLEIAIQQLVEGMGRECRAMVAAGKVSGPNAALMVWLKEPMNTILKKKDHAYAETVAHAVQAMQQQNIVRLTMPDAVGVLAYTMPHLAESLEAVGILSDEPVGYEVNIDLSPRCSARLNGG